MIGRDIRLGFAIEEPAILLHNRLVKDIFFGVDVSGVSKAICQVQAFDGTMTQDLLMFGGKNEIGALNVHTVLDRPIHAAGFLVLVRSGTKGNEETQGFV